MPYDISEAFQAIEEEMIASMSRNLKRHLETEKEEGLNYTMWQAEQLASLQEYRKRNKKRFDNYFSTINAQIDDVLKRAHQSGKMEQEVKILEALKKGWTTLSKPSKELQGAFFKINDRKLNALLDSVKGDMEKAETAMLRMADDEYRRVIYNSQVYYNTGVGTLSQCVDMATKDFLARGITCIEYANGARVSIDTYAKMSLRTASTRAYLLGESVKRDEWGVNTVIVNKRGVACPRCIKFVGKVFYDDVWSSVPVPSPEKYPRLSDAVAAGLYHPNCKDIHTTYFEGINTPPKPMTEEEQKEASRVYELEQRQRYIERQIRKYKRLSTGSIDPDNAERYKKKLGEWQKEEITLLKTNGDVLKRNYDNEKIFDIPAVDNTDIRRTVRAMRREVEEEMRNTSTGAGASLKHPPKGKGLTGSNASDIINSKEEPTLSSVLTGSDCFSEESKTKLRRCEKILAGNNYETAMVFDKNGKCIFEKKGSRDEIAFTANELKRFKDCVVTHNHPMNSGFSAEDIDTLRRCGASELRACTNTGTYVIRPPQKWPNSLKSVSGINAELNTLYDEIGYKYRDMAAREGRSIIYYLDDIDKDVMKSFGEKHGLYFEFDNIWA